MKIKLLKQWHINPPGTVMDLPPSTCEVLVDRFIAEYFREPRFADSVPDNRAVKSSQVKKK